MNRLIYSIAFEKIAAAMAELPPPPIQDYKGRWTTVGSGRLGIAKPGISDVDYMVPVEDLESLEDFNQFQGYNSAYKRDFDMEGYRKGSIVALPQEAYTTIDDSYAQANKRYSPEELRRMKEEQDKMDFYRNIGVVFTDDAMKMHGKTS